MSKEIQKNCIIVGPLDAYCLFCEYCLKTQDSILQHIQTTLHKEKFKLTPYFEQYKDDGIRQFKRGYYCEYCSVLVNTKKKVALHIIEGSHTNSKAVGTLQEVENGVVAFNSILIEDNAGHGVVDNTCLICNVDITNESDHIKDPSHIFILIQSKLDCIENNIFRKVDNDIFNCLICNIITKTSTFMTHLKNETHLTQLMKCKNAYNSSVNSTAIKNIHVENDSHNYYNNASEEFKPKEHQINKMETELCNKKEGNDISSDEKKDEKKIKHEQSDNMNNNKQDQKRQENEEASNHLKTTNDNSIKLKVEDSSIVKTNIVNSDGSVSVDNTRSLEPHEAIQIARDFSKKHKIKYSFGKHSAYCKACNVTISSSLQRMKDHVSLNEHKEKFSKRFVMAREPFAKFLNTYFKVLVLKDLDCEHVVVLNKKICISYGSFLMITSNQYAERCQLCQSSDDLYPYELHERTHRHKTLNWNTIVMCSFTSEFIREVRGSLYHCGFCNFLMTWTDLMNHLNSTSHKNNRDIYSLLLRDLVKSQSS